MCSESGFCFISNFFLNKNYLAINLLDIHIQLFDVMDSFHKYLLIVFHLFKTFLKFSLHFGDLGTFDDVLFHSHFAFEALVANLTNELRTIVIRSKRFDITILTLANVLRTIWKITELSIAVRTLVLFDTQMTINMRLVLILLSKNKSELNIWTAVQKVSQTNRLPCAQIALNRTRNYIRHLLRSFYASARALKI